MGAGRGMGVRSTLVLWSSLLTVDRASAVTSFNFAA
jgi:hypothetical protein